MRAIMFGILAHIAYALAVFIMGRKLAAVNPFLLNLLVAGIGTVLLLPALWRNPSLPIFTDTRLLGWIALASFLMIALGETLYVVGIQAGERTGDLRPFTLTALLFPVILAGLEYKRNPLDRWFLNGFLVIAIGFAIIVIRQRQ